MTQPLGSSGGIVAAPPNNLDTLKALVTFAEELGLRGPREVHMQRRPNLLTLTLPTVCDALAWCDAFGAGHNHSSRGEVYSIGIVQWLGWRVLICSFTGLSPAPTAGARECWRRRVGGTR